MVYTIYQGEKTEVRKDGITVLQAKVRGFFTLKLELYQGDKLIFKASNFAIALYRSIKILYQDLPSEISVIRTNSFSYNLLYQANEISIDFKVFKPTLLFKNRERIGELTYPKGITFGYSFAKMDLNSDEQDLYLYFAILYFLFNPKGINNR